MYRGESMKDNKVIFEENSNVFSSYISELNERTINSREIIVWFRNEEMFDTSKYFWCNDYMAGKLGIQRNDKGLIRTQDYYNTFVLDDEGNEMIEILKRASLQLKNVNNKTKNQYIVKLQNQETEKVFYIDFILEVFDRFPDGKIKTWGGNGIDISESFKRRKKIEYLASHDLVTNMLNRRYLFKNIKKLWSHCNRDRKYISFIMIDVDDFKIYNDNFGHIEGDRILKSVGKTIFESISRSLDVVGRYGGEEFLVVLPDTSIDGAYIIAEKIRNNVYDLKIRQNQASTRKYLSISLGVSCMIPSEEVTLEESIDCADKAMYKAKKNGKNKTVIYGE